MSECTVSELRKALITLKRIQEKIAEATPPIDPVHTSLVWDIEDTLTLIKDDCETKAYVVLGEYPSK
jgi:hypothetical protein